MPVNHKSYKLQIFPLTYMHIAAGEWLDPTQYVILRGRMYILNQPRLIAHLHRQDPAKLKAALELSHDKIAAFIYATFDPAIRDTWVQCHPVSEDMETRYRGDLENPGAQQLVSAFVSNHLTGNPYIPGSSLKGAIRTALTSYRLKDTRFSGQRLQSGVVRDMEPILFEYLNNYGKPDITHDPFKYLKIGDAEFPAECLVLRVVENKKKNDLEEKGRAHPGGELNYLCQALQKGSKGISARVDIDKRLLRDFPLDTIVASCNDYFREKLAKDAAFYKPARQEIHASFERTLAGLGPKQFLLRLGKGPGSLHKSVNDPEPTTRSFIGGLPLGICHCTIVEIV